MTWTGELYKKGFYQLKHFLPYQEATKLRKYILDAGHHQTWNLLTTPYYPLSKIKDEISTSQLDQSRHKQAVTADKRSQFAFSFYLTSNKHAKAYGAANTHQLLTQALLANVYPALKEMETKQRLTKPISEEELLKGQIRDSFLAAFVKGQFIGYHSDGRAGKFAFVYQLSQEWKKCYGGELVLYPTQLKFYKKIIVPKFNTLMILKLDHPMYHSVKLLNNPKHNPRLTISGWIE